MNKKPKNGYCNDYEGGYIDDVVVSADNYFIYSLQSPNAFLL